MSELAAPEKKAWQPFTPSGVACFATSSINRLLAIQILVAVLVAWSVIWFLSACYTPIILSAIQRLPETGEIAKQRLKGIDPEVLAENRFLSIAVESDAPDVSGVGDLQISFTPTAVKSCALLGCVEFAYPAGWIISLSRSTLEPAWGAWKPVILAGVGFLVAFGLLFSWAVFSTAYMFVAKLLAFYLDRELTWRGGWKLAAAAQMFAAVFVALAIVCYGANLLDLLRFLIFYALHFPIAWVFLVAALYFLPKISDAPTTPNPFTTGEEKAS